MWNESKKLSRVFGLCSMNIPIILSHYFNSTGALNRAMIWLKFLFGNDLLMLFYIFLKSYVHLFLSTFSCTKNNCRIDGFLLKFYSFIHWMQKIHHYVNCFYIKKSFSSLPLTDFFSQKLRLQKENYDKLYVTLFSVYLQKVAGLF